VQPFNAFLSLLGVRHGGKGLDVDADGEDSSDDSASPCDQFVFRLACTLEVKEETVKVVSIQGCLKSHKVIRQKRIHQPLMLWCRDKDIWCWE